MTKKEKDEKRAKGWVEKQFMMISRGRRRKEVEQEDEETQERK